MFFRVLSGPQAPVYVDVLDALEVALQSAGSLPRSEALEIVSDVVRIHPGFAVSDEFPDAAAEASTLSGLSGLILRRLVETGWLHEPPRPDWQRIVHFSPNGEIVIEALRQIARGQPAQFTDKIQQACAQLLNPDQFAEDPFANLEACLASVRQGLRELRQMENIVARHTRSLLNASSLQENLSVLYDQFSETFGHACYRELVRAQLPTRILKATRSLDEMAQSERILEAMQRERLRRSPPCDFATAAAEVRLKISELGRLLSSVGPQADELDRRAADFARRAFARVRYLHEVSSGQREQVQRLFSAVEAQFQGERLTDLPDSLALPGILMLEADILSADSLRKPPLRREPGELEAIGDDLSETERDAAVREIEDTLRDSMNVLRANRYVSRLDGPVGTQWTLADLPLHSDDDLADLVACLLHAGSRDAAYELETERMTRDTSEPSRVHRLGYDIEELSLKKR